MAKVFVCLPLMDELENIGSLLACLQEQSYTDFHLIACVNQPDAWWNEPEKKPVCEANLKTLHLLEGLQSAGMTIIDRCSPGKGWKGKHFGVGWARKTAMDAAAAMASADDLMVCMDGDSLYPHDYLEIIATAFAQNPVIKGMAIPYFHPLGDDENANKAILRYEIYMRYYALNMMRTGNPYAFTAIGSAMACRVTAYRAINGITPHKSGEDFYFIQKLRKFGSILIDVDTQALPAARFSDRVFFGTGPAMIRGSSGDWTSYPIYPHSLFDEVKRSFDAFGSLYKSDLEIPMSEFLIEKFGDDLWDKLRRNAKTESSFIKACHGMVDGLRILQFLKWRHQADPGNDEENLQVFLQHFYKNETLPLDISAERFSLADADVDILGKIRSFLLEQEKQWQKKLRILNT